jgi:hypothetical protein
MESQSKWKRRPPAPVPKLPLFPSPDRQCQNRSVLRETPLCRYIHRKRRSELRRCCVCGIAVKNSNLAGFTGRSALSGRLFCLHCEDVGGCL